MLSLQPWKVRQKKEVRNENNTNRSTDYWNSDHAADQKEGVSQQVV